MTYSVSDEKPPKHRSSKDTKRWCRGKVGREHRWKFVVHRTYPTIYCWYPVCQECGKQRWVDLTADDVQACMDVLNKRYGYDVD